MRSPGEQGWRLSWRSAEVLPRDNWDAGGRTIRGRGRAVSSQADAPGIIQESWAKGPAHATVSAASVSEVARFVPNPAFTIRLQG